MSAADAQLKSIIDRVLRLKEEQDELAIEIREIYAEAKGSGYDKTALGQVVSHLRKVEKVGRDALTERETMFDLYLTSYETGTTLATHTHEAKNGYASQKGIDPKLAHTIVTGMQTETGRKTLIAAVDIMIEREERIDAETGEILDDTVSFDGEGQEAPSSDVDADAANTGGDDVNSSAMRASSDVEVVATNSPETANEVPAQDGGGTATSESSSGKSNAARPASVDAQLNAGGQAGQACDSDVTVVGTESGTVANSEITPDPRPLTDADGHPRIPSSSPGCAKTNGLQSIGGQGRESENCITGNQEEQAVDQFTPPAFLKAASEGPKLNPQCQKAAKGEKCTFSHSMASCWRCTDSAMKEKSAASKRVSA
ncbi:DUF2312 domain-containing protein [Phyllobacterium calauticae]|uniref:DUF2312 domain-containing protein n=1 Tax=Phyllobacterium calauticae TaxID=2817027 RepID=UPI001CBC86EC|nr:DUF2312 domain-containing protein [Phyllobacterium calauticae]MBZ3691015.1 DUF2312 domain-containing protein [Phyllobacterium calauticae]